MDLYFSPLACSMATRIALYEAGAEAHFVEVDTKAKRTRDGADYWAINPLGLVPAIRTDDGELLTENAAILQYVADPLSRRAARAACRDGSIPPAAVAVFHRHRIAQNVIRAAARCQGARGSQDLRAGKGRACHGLSQRLSLRPRVPARPLQRRRCLSVHGAELEHGGVRRSRALAGGEGLLQPHAPASVHWKGARRGTRTLRRAAGPPQSGLTEVRPRVPARSCFAFMAMRSGFGSAAPARRRRRQPAPRLDQELVAAQNSLLQRDRAPLTSSHRPFARVSGTRPQYSRICRAHAAKNWCGSTDSGVTTGIEVGSIRHVRLSLGDGWSKCRYGKNPPGQ